MDSRAFALVRQRKVGHAWSVLPKQFERRFWSKVARGDDSACWPWTAGTVRGGYGWIWLEGSKRLQAHRAAFMLERGEIPPGVFVCHTCDNPACCNPSHLFLGTVKDNSDDMIAKGRGRKATGDANGSRLYPARRPRGSAVNTAKLTPELVREIQASAEASRPLARRLGVAHSTILRARRGDSWVAPRYASAP